MRAAPPSTGRPGPTEAPQPAAGAGKNIGHRPDDDDKQHNADHKGQDVGQSAAAAALPALIARLHGAAVLIASIVQIYAINARNGVGHIICTGDYRIAIITVCKITFHGLGDGAGLLCQRGVAEAIAVGQVVVAVRVLRRLHHQQDQNTIIVRGIADSPSVKCFCGIIFRRKITCVLHSQNTNLCAFTVRLQFCIQFFNRLRYLAIQRIGIVHHALILGQAGQLGGKGRRAQHRRADHHGQHQCADAFCKVFHAKGSTSLTPDKAPSTPAGKPPTSF